MKQALTIYRLALVAYPRRFRRLWGEDMVEVLAYRLERAWQRRGALGVVSGLARALADTLSNGLLARFSRNSSPRRSPQLPRQQEPLEMIHRVFWNLRQAARTLVHQPAVSALIVATLALGTGGTVAFFGIADAALLRPLPYPEPDRLVSLHQSSERFGQYGWAAPFLPELREQTRSYDDLVGFSPAWTLTMTDPGEPRTISAIYVGSGVFELFGARFVAGRGFTASEFEEGASPVAVVNEGFWERHFGANESLARQTLTLDGASFEIVGIIDDSLRMPFTTSAVTAGSASIGVWVPLAQNAFLTSRARPIVNVVARLASGVSPATAASELTAVNARFAEEHPDVGLAAETGITSLLERVAADSVPILSLLLGASALLLCIACANVANLLLARASARTEEMAIRASLGATRLRIIEQLLTESLVLASLGGALGLVIAGWLLRVIPALGFLDLPESATVGLDLRVVAFAFALSIGTALLFGLVPALRLARRDAAVTPSNGTRATDAQASRLRSGLVAAEVALAVVLLIGAGLLTRSFTKLISVDPGFKPDGIVASNVSPGQQRWLTRDDRRSFYRQLQESVAARAGIDAVAAVNRVPLGGVNVFAGVEFEIGGAEGEDIVTMDRRVVTPGYFETIGIPFRTGRDFNASDSAESEQPVGIINETAAALLAPLDPIGVRARIQYSNGFGPWMRIVGVVGDIHHHGLDEPVSPELYVPYEQAPVQNMAVLMRTELSPESSGELFKAAVWQLDDEIAIDGTQPLEDLISASVADPRVRMFMMQSFAGLALLLAGIGVGGVVSYTVARRSRDYGVRIALGARPAEVLRLALRDGLVPGALGALVGVIAALGLSRWVESLLFATSPNDPLTFAGVAVTLMALVSLASWIPARRATRVDPVSVLRDE